MLRVGLEDSRMGMEIPGPYLAHCHIGNGIPVEDGTDEKTGRTQWKWQFSDVREGVADLAQIVGDLKSIGYGGCLSLEEFGPGDDGEKIASQGAWIRRWM